MLYRFFEFICRPIINRLEAIMASSEQLQEQIADVKSSLEQAIGRVQEDVEALRARADQGIDPADLDPISTGLSELKDSLDALDPDPANPPVDQPPQEG